MTQTQAVLAGDVGGTNTRLALFPVDGRGVPLLQRIYPSAEYPGLLPIVERFIREASQLLPYLKITRAGFGVAGPTDGKHVKFTNLPWTESSQDLAQACCLERVVFVNDFAAVCRAVPQLAPEHLVKFGGGDPQAGAPIAVLGAGTGLGVGFLVPGVGGAFRIVQSGGGHVGFAPRNRLQLRLAGFLQSHRDGSYLENVLSGRGLENIYSFLREDGAAPELTETRTAMERESPAAVISSRGMSQADPLCRQSVELFCSIYGAAAGSFAILVLAGGGVYVAGGIAGHLRDLLGGEVFREAFEAQEQYSDFLRGLPRYLITHPQPGLLGAALAAIEEE